MKPNTKDKTAIYVIVFLSGFEKSDSLSTT